jgi:FAD/FMN-containing dehydrogenase
VLGIEAVLPNGEIWNGLKALRKDNTGYDLKHLLMGAEGTLGIITACVLKLYPKPSTALTAMIAVASPAESVRLLGTLRDAVGDRLVGFELMARNTIAHTLAIFPNMQEPFAAPYDWQVLVQLADTVVDAPLADTLAAALESSLDDGTILDAAIASNETQAAAMWSIREHIPEAEKRRGKSVKHDIALPISRIAEFITRANAALASAFPKAEVICFGHVGDGNLHYNLSFPGSAPTPAQTREANAIVYALIDELDGSISAEHGLGQLKRDEIVKHKSAAALSAMRAIKAALDPHNIMNPGKVI